MNHLFPAFSAEHVECGLQQDPLLFSCAGSSAKFQRLCPCRDYRNGQVALCRDCLWPEEDLWMATLFKRSWHYHETRSRERSVMYKQWPCPLTLWPLPDCQSRQDGITTQGTAWLYFENWWVWSLIKGLHCCIRTAVFTEWWCNVSRDGSVKLVKKCNERKAPSKNVSNAWISQVCLPSVVWIHTVL